MLFNSIDFFIFLPIVYLLYWFVTKTSLRYKNILLLAASYFFYGCWDWRFLFLLIFSTSLDYFTGIKIADAPTINNKKFWLWLSISINLGFLGVFKYYNFFIESFAGAIGYLGVNTSFSTLNIILPVGISFYTFHGLSYVIDIYYNKIKPEKNVVDYSLFVSFFPLLVAGPIERATHLLPQLKQNRQFDYNKTIDGLQQILWGLFKKVVIADNCAAYANILFNEQGFHSGSSLVLGAIFFSFQIYCDFSGYSDIALGTARLFGIELLKNFSFPYFSRDIAEFWRRWHISLSSWFKDYLYIPLGGSKGNKFAVIKNTFIIFLVSGLWHGANWTFLVWGLLNAIYFLPLLILDLNRKNIDIVAKNSFLPTFIDFFKIIFTFSMVTLAWIFFRASSVIFALTYIKNIFNTSLFSVPQNFPLATFSLLILFIALEWISRKGVHPFEKIKNIKYLPIRWSIYYTIVFSILLLSGKPQQFIYFQF